VTSSVVPEKLISFVQFGQIGFYFHKILANYDFVVFIIVILFSVIKVRNRLNIFFSKCSLEKYMLELYFFVQKLNQITNGME
jgi:hypothetical protein